MLYMWSAGCIYNLPGLLVLGFLLSQVHLKLIWCDCVSEISEYLYL